MMDVYGTFLELTKRTYPFKSEHKLIKIFPDGYNLDSFGNLFYIIGNSNVMFTSHLDTASSEQDEVSHQFIDDFIFTDGTTILGADDKAGVTIMLNMIHNNIPGLYYFFLGEEEGLLGSNALFANTVDSKVLNNIKSIISFDRKGYGDIITHMYDDRVCSDDFGNNLANMFNEHGFDYSINDTGGMTDSYIFREGRNVTNISVGYFNEHQLDEHQDMVFLQKLASVCLKIKWELL